MRPDRGGEEFSPPEPEEDLPGPAIMVAMAAGVLACFVAIVWGVALLFAVLP